MVTKENFEEYVLLYTDKELTKVEENALLDFVALHPELKQELDAYSSIILTPDTDIVFSEKKSLLKEAPKVSIINLSKYKMYYTAAASIVAVIFILFFNKSENQPNSIAQNTTITETPIKKGIGKNTTPIKNTTPTHPRQPQKNNIVQSSTMPLPSARKSRMTEPIQMELRPNNSTSIGENSIAALDVMPVTTDNFEPLDIEKTSSFFESNLTSLLTLNNTEGLTELSKIVTDKISNAKNVAKQLKGSDVKFKLGNKEILIATL